MSDFWQFRELLHQLTLRDIRIRYKQAVMGFAWAIFMPGLIVLSGLGVRYAFAIVADTPLDASAVLGISVKALGWAFFVGTVAFATATLVGNQILVTRVYFPREILPLAATLTQAFDSLIGGLALGLVLPLVGYRPKLAVLWAPALVLLLFLFTFAAALALSCANLFFRDVKYIVQVFLTFGIFFTPVLYEPAMFGPVGAKIMMLNPLAPLLEGLRLSVVEGHNLLAPLVITSAKGQAILAWSPWYLAYALLWCVGALLIGSLVFHRLEFVFAEYI